MMTDTAQQWSFQIVNTWLAMPPRHGSLEELIASALQQAHLDALAEAVKVCNDLREQARHQDLSGGYTAELIANQLDRLREGVE